ncbi:MAG: DUF3854 domain-containing protein, partial [Prochlorococcus sp.]
YYDDLEIEVDATTTHGQTGRRANEKRKLEQRISQCDVGWSIYGVALQPNDRKPCAGMAYMGIRIHPSKRFRGWDGKIFKVNSSAFDPISRGLFLPPLSYDGAIELLEGTGFSCRREDYQPHMAWLHVLQRPEISIWVEESALKAMASCSQGQLAVGLNGISSAGPVGRSDRLKAGLRQLIKDRRRVVVRFDGSTNTNSKSQSQARAIARKVKTAGAINAYWFTWWPDGPLKTDDASAAVITGHPMADTLRLQFEIGVDDRKARLLPYSRLEIWQPTATVEREFVAEDILNAREKRRRVIALLGATGTGKTKATVAAIEAMEHQAGRKMIVLGAYHRASLTGKGAHDFGVISMSAEHGSAERSGALSTRDGLFCCGESAYKDTSEKSLWHWAHDLAERPRPTVLVLDELSQTLPAWMINGSAGMAYVREKAVQALEMLVANPQVVVIAADAFLGDIELDWLKVLSGEEPWLVKSTFTQPDRTLYLGSTTNTDLRLLLGQLQRVKAESGRIWVGAGQKDILGELVDDLMKSGRVLACINSQQIDAIRITADTNADEVQGPMNRQFLGNVNVEGLNYSLVAFSPAMSSGISFDAATVGITGIVQAYAWSAADVVQALNRARRSEMRVLLSPDIAPEAKGVFGETTPQRVRDVMAHRAGAGNLPDFVEKGKRLSSATVDAMVRLDARQSREAVENARVVRAFLKQEGYTVKPLIEMGIGLSDLDVSIDPVQEESQATTDERLATAQQAAMQRLLTGESSMEQEQGRAKRASADGTLIDLVLADVSELWDWAVKLRLHELVQAGSVRAGCDELRAIWAELCALDRKQVRQLCGAFSSERVKVRSNRIPTSEDADQKEDMRKIRPLLNACGFTTEALPKVKLKGRTASGWQIVPIPLAVG